MNESGAEKPKPKFSTVEQISAGGVAFRLTASGEIETAIVSAKPSLRWQLPKGIIDAGETPEIAAVREVREEAGIETELLELIEKVEYWYVGFHRGDRVRFHKFVYFYLLKYLRGDVADHDHEIAEARWVKPAEAIEMLAFKSEKQVVEKSLELIKRLA
ncbi:MAG: NUDIX domain-containing protein [Acidobacteriota bacterium]|nr:NUDIX domain-containing protein [Acidobacteriota bacterium]